MIEVAFKGLTETVATLTNAQRQIPFAASQACNDVARDVQQWTIRERLPEAFTLRSRGAPWWRPGTRMGFNIQFAKKTSLTAVLGSQADWLKLQEEGGTKTADGHRVAIPTPAWKARTDMMIAAKKPKALRDMMSNNSSLNRVNDRIASLGRVRGRVTAAEARARNGITASSDRAQKNKLRGIAKALRSRRHALTAQEKRAHRERMGIVRANDRAGKMAGSLKNTPFLATVNGSEGIFVRKGPGRLPIQRLFSFVSSSKLNAVLKWEKAAAIRAKLIYEAAFTHRWAEAIRNMR
jgi:hypothetical protein